MQEVADDEIRHAELSWAVDAWLEPQLSDTERAQIDLARRNAVDALRRSVAAPTDRELQHLAGVPDPRTATAMLHRVASDLWNWLKPESARRRDASRLFGT